MADNVKQFKQNTAKPVAVNNVRQFEPNELTSLQTVLEKKHPTLKGFGRFLKNDFDVFSQNEDPDLYIQAVIDLMNSTTNEKLRDNAAFVVLNSLNFVSNKPLNEKQEKLLSVNGNGFRKAIDLLVNNPSFLIDHKSSIVDFINNNEPLLDPVKSHFLNAFKENKSREVYFKLMIDKTINEYELTEIRLKKGKTNDELERKVLTDLEKRKQQDFELSKQFFGLYQSGYSAEENETYQKSLGDIRKKVKQIYSDKLSGIITDPDLLTCIQSKRENLPLEMSLQYQYRLNHSLRMKKIMDYEATYKAGSLFNFYKRDTEILEDQITKNNIFDYNPITNGYAIAKTKQSHIIIPDVVDKLLVKDPFSKIYVNFGSAVEQSEKEETAKLVIEEMKTFLLDQTASFRSEMHLIEHIKRNVKIEGVDIDDIIKSVFPENDKSISLTAETVSKSFSDNVLDFSKQMESDIPAENKQSLFFVKQLELKDEIINNRNTTADQKNQLVKILETMELSNVGDTCNKLLETVKGFEINSNKVVPLINEDKVKQLETVKETENRYKDLSHLAFLTVSRLENIAAKESNIELKQKILDNIDSIISGNDIDFIKASETVKSKEINRLFTELVAEFDSDKEVLAVCKLAELEKSESLALETVKVEEPIITEPLEQVASKSNTLEDLLDNDIEDDFFRQLAELDNEIENTVEKETINPLPKNGIDKDLDSIYNLLKNVIETNGYTLDDSELQETIQQRKRVNASLNARISDIKKIKRDMENAGDLDKLLFDLKETNKPLDLSMYSFDQSNDKLVNNVNIAIRCHNAITQLDEKLPNLQEYKKDKKPKKSP